jgi:hypothetical protein
MRSTIDAKRQQSYDVSLTAVMESSNLNKCTVQSCTYICTNVQIMYFRDPISNADDNQACVWAELGNKTISPAASFVLGIHFTNSYFCDSWCPFGQIDNQKQMLGRCISNFQKICWLADLKRASGPLDYCKLNLMGHRLLEVMDIWKL